MPSETIELRGHIMDSHTLEKILDQIMALGADYEIESFELANTSVATSFCARSYPRPEPRAAGKSSGTGHAQWSLLARREDARIERAPRDGIFPDDFYATTNLPTEIMLGGKWINVANAEMDCAIVVDPKRNLLVVRACIGGFRRRRSGCHRTRAGGAELPAKLADQRGV